MAGVGVVAVGRAGWGLRALAGGAEYLITNDRDLLDLPEEFQRSLPFAILKPEDFLKELGID